MAGSVRRDGKVETRVAETARALAELSLEHDEGAFLGDEDDLLRRLGVSRPTLRQAAKVAENDRMISVRRGLRGGFYAARPDAAAAIHTLTRYLRLKGAFLMDVLTVARPCAEEAAGSACRCTDPALRSRLDHFAGAIAELESRGALMRADRELSHLLAEMSGNPLIDVVLAIGSSFGLEEQSSLYCDPQQREQARELLSLVCRAVLEGDADLARLRMRRRMDVLVRWLGQPDRDAPAAPGG